MPYEGYECLRVERERGVAFVTIDHPPINLFDLALMSEVDRLGRILLPKHLRDFAQIKQDVVIIGVANRLEIWSKERWKEYYTTSREDYEDVAQRILSDEA